MSFSSILYSNCCWHSCYYIIVVCNTEYSISGYYCWEHNYGSELIRELLWVGCNVGHVTMCDPSVTPVTTVGPVILVVFSDIVVFRISFVQYPNGPSLLGSRRLVGRDAIRGRPPFSSQRDAPSNNHSQTPIIHSNIYSGEFHIRSHGRWLLVAHARHHDELVAWMDFR